MEEMVILESNLRDLKGKIVDDIYDRPGVWSLYGKRDGNQWRCLEVAKTASIKDEIMSAIYILITLEHQQCIECTKTHPAKKRFGENSADFLVHNCKSCEHIDKLRTKSWKRNPRYIDKYKHMVKEQYNRLKFVCVCMSEEMKDDKKRIEVERYYANEKKALYWWG